jgi:hypothetical protein
LFKRNRDKQQQKNPASLRPLQCVFEPLEDRRLLSASLHAENLGGSGVGEQGIGVGYGEHGHSLNTIQFSQAPSAVQTGLTTLATHDNVTAPTATTTVYLGNSRGVETYTIAIASTGTNTRLTVDQNGNPVTAPTNSTTTFGAVPAAVSTEVNKIASALSLTAPASTDSVRVSTPASGAATYTIRLVSSTTTGRHTLGVTVSVDANGNPVGNQNLPFSTLPTAIQNGLNSNRPSGATALASTSTQSVRIRTTNGVTTYSTTFTTSGTSTTVTVNSGGQLTKLPSRTTAQFQTIPSAAKTELQTLANANGVSGVISPTQTVNIYDEANGTTIYSVTLGASKTATGGQTYTVNLTISVDQTGNPTTPPQDGGGEGFGDHFGGFAGSGFGGFGFVGHRGR